MSAKKIPYKMYLTEEEMPKKWLNLKAFMKEQHEPFLNPATGKPCTAEELEVVFCRECVEQELNCTDKYIDIPEGISDFYTNFRPSPLIRAYFLEKLLDTPAEIYYKFEGNNTSGSHKLNSAAAQAYYAKKQGLKSITTETGAGQWGTALAMAAAFYGLDLMVFMVKTSYEQKPYRKEVIRTYGADIVASPSDTTEAGRKILREFPGTGGSLGCAIAEAVETAIKTPDCRYVLGSVLDHVLLHQSVIGMESKVALDKYGVTPDMIIGCMGGGSNYGGLIAPYMAEKLQGKNDIEFIGVEPASCPSMSRGKYAYDYCDSAKITPLAKMYTLGCGFMPSPDHAGARAGIQPRHKGRYGRSGQMQGNGRKESHTLRAYRHGLFRYGGIQAVQRRHDEGLYPHGRGPRKGFCKSPRDRQRIIYVPCAPPKDLRRGLRVQTVGAVSEKQKRREK